MKVRKLKQDRGIKLSHRLQSSVTVMELIALSLVTEGLTTCLLFVTEVLVTVFLATNCGLQHNGKQSILSLHF